MVAQDAAFRVLLITLMLQALAIGSMLAGIDYLARYVLRDPGAASIGFVCVVGPALLVSPLWLAFGKRYGKKTGFTAASVILGLGALGLTQAAHVPTWCVVPGNRCGRHRLHRRTGVPTGDAAGRRGG